MIDGTWQLCTAKTCSDKVGKRQQVTFEIKIYVCKINWNNLVWKPNLRFPSGKMDLNWILNYWLGINDIERYRGKTENCGILNRAVHCIYGITNGIFSCSDCTKWLNDLEISNWNRFGKKWECLHFKYYSCMWMEGLRKTTPIIQDTHLIAET